MCQQLLYEQNHSLLNSRATAARSASRKWITPPLGLLTFMSAFCETWVTALTWNSFSSRTFARYGQTDWSISRFWSIYFLPLLILFVFGFWNEVPIFILQARPVQTINVMTYHWFQQHGTSLAAMSAHEERKTSVSDALQQHSSFLFWRCRVRMSWDNNVG